MNATRLLSIAGMLVIVPLSIYGCDWQDSDDTDSVTEVPVTDPGSAVPPTDTPTATIDQSESFENLTVQSQCARVDYSLDGNFFALCLGGCQERWGCDVTGCEIGCQVDASLRLACSSGVPTDLQLRLEPSGGPMVGSAQEISIVGSFADPVASFSFDSNDLQPGTIYDLVVVYECGGTPVEHTIGFGGLCDPKGHIPIPPSRVDDPDGNATPEGMQGATVTLFTIPGAPDDPEPGSAGSGDCRNPLTRAAAQPSPTPGANNWDPYWNDWSGEAAPNAIPQGAATAAVPAPQTNPQQTDANGNYGWLVDEGCYFVMVDPTTAPAAPAGLPTALSPVVGNVASIDPAYVVDDLDLSYVY